MQRQKILALILAGGKGSRLEVLTEERAKPTVPFAGTYRLIDFALSNCVHSRLSDVWVIEQYQLHTLNDHLANGRPWDLDRTYGGLQVLPPYVGNDDDPDDEGGFAYGNADAIYRHKNLINEFAPDLLLILSADHLYKLDYRDVIEQHLANKAEVTMVVTRVPLKEASRFGVVEVNEDGLVTDFAYKPEHPTSDTVTTEVFVYNAKTLIETLDQLAEEGQPETNEKDQEKGVTLKDFGDKLLPRLVKDGRAFAYTFDGYWRDVGTVESYWKAHMDLLSDSSQQLALDDADWPILTYGTQRLPARIYSSAKIENSLISPGCVIRGAVIRSVLAPGVLVEADAMVRDSIIWHDARIAGGARITRAVIDEEVEVGEKAVIGSSQTEGKTIDDEMMSNEDITLIGRRRRIEPAANIPTGARLKPEAED